MKILFCDNTLWGLLNFRGGVIRHFVGQGNQVTLVAPEDNTFDLSGLPEGVKYIPVDLERTGTNPAKDYRYYRALKTIYKKEKPDYIFHYTIKPNIYGTLAAHTSGIRSSCMIAGLGHVYSAKGLGNAIARLMYRYAIQYSERVMVLNRSNYDLLIGRRVVKPGQLLWLKGGEGIDLQKFQPLSLPKNPKPVFLMICRLLYEKGYAEYIAAAEALKDRAVFRIMGPIDSHPSAVPRRIVEADSARGVIEYIPYSPDVVARIAEADCIVLPSYHEGLSRILMEGIASGRPVIATNIPGCNETVDESVNGFLCRPADTLSLTKACERFINLTQAEKVAMSTASRLKAETVFDERRVIARYEELLNFGCGEG